MTDIVSLILYAYRPNGTVIVHMPSRAAAEHLAQTIPVLPYYAGRWDSDGSKPAFDVIDPVNERRLLRVAESGPAEVDSAVSSARSALDRGEWGKTDGASRGRLLSRLADLLEQRSEEFALLEFLISANRRNQRTGGRSILCQPAYQDGRDRIRGIRG